MIRLDRLGRPIPVGFDQLANVVMRELLQLLPKEERQSERVLFSRQFLQLFQEFWPGLWIALIDGDISSVAIVPTLGRVPIPSGVWSAVETRGPPGIMRWSPPLENVEVCPLVRPEDVRSYLARMAASGKTADEQPQSVTPRLEDDASSTARDQNGWIPVSAPLLVAEAPTSDASPNDPRPARVEPPAAPHPDAQPLSSAALFKQAKVAMTGIVRRWRDGGADPQRRPSLTEAVEDMRRTVEGLSVAKAREAWKQLAPADWKKKGPRGPRAAIDAAQFKKFPGSSN